MKKLITVFGSSIPVDNDEQYITAYNLGKQLAMNGFDICTGGFNGIMEAASKGTVDGGGQAIGVTVDLWGRSVNRYINEEVKCNTLLERIDKLIELGDGYVILQGGTGTLLEVAAVWEYMNKGLMEIKPVACHSSMWKKVVSEINVQMKYENRSTELIKTYDTVEEITEFLVTNLRR